MAHAQSSAGLPASSIADMTVRQSDAQVFVFEYRPKYHEERVTSSDNRQFMRFDFDGGVRTATEGSPDLRSVVFPIALPSAAGNVVQIVASEYEENQNVVYAPVPHYRDRESMPVAADYVPIDAAYRRSQISAAGVVELLPPTRSRSVLVGRVRVTPVQYDGSRNVVRKYSRLLIQVTFGTPTSGTPVSTDDPLVRSAVLNGEVLRNWKGPVGLKKGSTGIPSVLASGDWYRIPVAADGIYKIDAKYLSSAGINLAAVKPRTIKIYGNGGTEVPENPTLPRIADLAENAIYVDRQDDSTFDQNNFILFFGRSTRGVYYDAAIGTMRHYIHHYTDVNNDVNYYWLTFGGADGKRMTQVPSSAATPDYIAETFTDIVAVEEEKVNLISSGRRWFGQSLNGPAGSFTHVNVLPDLVPGGTITYRYCLVAHSDQSPTFTVRDGANVIGTHTLSASYGYLYATEGTYERTGSLPSTVNTSQLNFTISGASSSQGWIDWVEILYPRRLWAVGNALRFRAPDSTRTVEYRLQQFSAAPTIFDVTTHDNVKLITGVTGSYVFRRAEVHGQPSEYYAAGPSAWKAPPAMTKMANQDLRGYSGGADFIIITSEEFRSAAERLRAHREQQSYGWFNTYVADVSRIYNEFSGGLPDVSAIRDFLKYAYENWSPHPQFVLLFGGATYDYKSILGKRSTFVPTWQSLESLDEIYSYSTDDFFAKFGSSDNISLVLGRISSRTAAEAGTVVDKILRYDQQSARDPWKMRMLFVGDDAFTTEGGEIGDRTLHSDDQETLAGSTYTPDEFEKKKIYIAEYPTVNTALGRRKPTANQAIIDQVNQGVLIFNYAGHGRADLLAHEHIFEVQTSVPQLINTDKLAVWYLATCGFSQFDDPNAYTGSEFLMNKPDGGAVAVVSATRKVYAGANAALNQGSYRKMFTRDVYGRLVVERPATALFLYKVLTGDFDPNDQKFCFMGDPTMRLQYPSAYATIDSINGQRVDSLNGAPRTSPILVQSLSHVTVSGTLRGPQNQPDASFNGRSTLVMHDATRRQYIVNFYPGYTWDYLATGGTIFRGDNTVHDGQFKASFVIPKDIAYGDTTSRGRLVSYFSGQDFDGAAYTPNVRIAGADSSVRNDGRGPEMSLYVNSREFRPGDMVSENPVLYVDLRDSNGINTSGAGIGHRIEAWLNGSLQSRDLTDFYASKLDNYREGTVQYPLTNLPQGRNTLKVRAWDSFNNSSTAETYFTVASSDGLVLADVLNFPNPFGETTLFTFRQNQSMPLNVTIKVFTVAGRLIRTIESMTNGEPTVRIPWDGRDQEGDRIANGVYLYKLIARTVDGRFTSEAIEKVSVLK